MDILEDCGGYRMSIAEDGASALQMLEAEPEGFDVVLLDRVMPGVDGMEVLFKMKQHDVLQNCPVILQTGKTSVADMTEGLEAGAHFYLNKPFDEGILLSVIQSAVRVRLQYKKNLADLGESQNLVHLLENACFKYKTIEDARCLASMLSHAFSEPGKVVMGLTELMVNAVEHGNLSITYDEKSVLNSEGSWDEEIKKRLALPEYSDREVLVFFKDHNGQISVTVTDEGDGFDWKQYLNFSPHRVMDNHGRGIAIANKMSFSKMKYNEKGNEVCAWGAV